MTEQRVLKISLAAVLLFSVLGITFGLVSGSYAITFDGMFSLVDAAMSVVSIVVSGLIVRSTTNQLSARLRRRFSMGFWHFEPFVLTLQALSMTAITAYALVQAVAALLDGGRDVEFGPAVVYAGVVIVLSAAVGWWEHRANRRIGSALVAMDVKGWVMAGGVTAALLIAFVGGLVIDGTRLEWLTPYVDPGVLALVCLVLIPVPLSTLRRAVAELAMVTPRPLQQRAEEVARRVVEAEDFSDHRVHVAQVGRSRQVELVFQVPTGRDAEPLEHWDAIRARVEQELDGDDPHSWISITFTTRQTASG